MTRIVKTIALVGALSLTVVLGTHREAEAAVLCQDVEGYSCPTEGATLKCYTGGTAPSSKWCECFWGVWTCS